MTRELARILSTVLLVAGAAFARDASAARRIAGRTFPSIFQAWSPVQHLDEDRLTSIARHDLYFTGPEAFGLRWNNEYRGLGTGFDPASVEKGRAMRRELLRKNPQMVFLAEIRYRDAHRSYLPADHPWWKRGADGKIEAGWEEGGFLKLDFGNPQYRQHVAAQARAAVESGVFDGVMLDWWTDDDDRLALVKQVRDAIGDALLMANANDRKTPRTAPFLNGYFMECTRSRTAADWQKIADTLAWAEKELRSPRVNCLETWYHNSRADLHLMRATTTLSLVLSDGYALFSDPNPLPTPDHLHDWYPFWNKSLGKATGAGAKAPDGTIRREFEHGTAVHNPFGNAERVISFREPRKSVATGVVAKEHRVVAGDGDLFLK